MGVLRFETGDLLAADLPAIAHGCNTAGVMGAGVARAIAERFPHVLGPYRRACRDGSFTLGAVLPIGADPVVYNLATQLRPGPCASLDAIAMAVAAMLDDAAARGIAVVGMPRIGAGLGGLSWDAVEAEVEPLVVCSKVDVVVFTLPGQFGTRQLSRPATSEQLPLFD